MAVTYPSIPIPLVSGYTQKDSIKTQAIAVVTGAPRIELMSETSPVFFKVNWFFTDAEMRVFDGWFKYSLSLGSLSFNINLKVGGGLKAHEVYFDGKTYSSSLVGKEWKVSANLIGILKQYDDLSTYETARDSLTPPLSFVSNVTLLSPIHWWRLNENSGLLASDSGSGSADVTYEVDASDAGFNASPSSNNTGAGSQSKHFKNNQSAIDAISLAGTIGNLTTFEFLFNAAIFANGRVLSRLAFANASRQWYLHFNSFPASIAFAIYDTGGSATIFNIAPLINAYRNEWNYCSITYNDTTKIINTRVNNVQVSNVSTSGSSLQTISVDSGFGIGADYNGANDMDNGLYDEVQIYNKILTSDQRDANFNFWQNGNDPPLCIGFPNVLISGMSRTVTNFGGVTLPSAINVCAGQFIAYEFDQTLVDASNLFLMRLETGTSVDIDVYFLDTATSTTAATLRQSYGIQSGTYNFSWDSTGFEGEVTWLVFLNTTGSTQSIKIIDDQP